MGHALLEIFLYYGTIIATALLLLAPFVLIIQSSITGRIKRLWVSAVLLVLSLVLWVPLVIFAAAYILDVTGP